MGNRYLLVSTVTGICLAALLLGTISASAIGNADIVISENGITFSETNIFAGVPVNITAVVENNGTDAALGILVSFVDKNETGVETIIRLAPVFDLAAGANTTVSAAWTPMTAGNHTINVRATCTVDANTKNNEANKTVYVRSGTLNVTAYASPSNPFPSKAFWVNGTVTYMLPGMYNLPASNATVTIGMEGVNATYQAVTDVDGIYSKQVTAPSSLGQCNISVAASKGDSYHGNTTTSILVQAPDLTVKEITLSSEKPTVGDVVKINAAIGNVGNMNATNVTVRFYVDNIKLNDTTISNLSANSSAAVEAEWTAEAGEHTIKVAVDPDNGTAEANNGNNENEKAITVERKTSWMPGFEAVGIISAIGIIGVVYSNRKRTN